MGHGNQSRRDFLKKGGAAAAGVAALPFVATACKAQQAATGGAPAAAKAKVKNENPKVVIARADDLFDGNKLNEDKAKNLLFKAVRELSGKDTDAAAWGAYYGPADTVGIKVNCIAGKGMSSNPEVVRAMVAGLMLAGVKPGNIIIWDREEEELRRAGFEVGTAANGVRCIATDSVGAGYDEELTTSGEVASRVSRVASTMCNSLLNSSVLKDHGLSGVTVALKNYFGAIHNPNKLHGNGCCPGIADSYAIPAFSDKTRLCICDATTAQYNGGPAFKPAYTWKYGGFILSDDPVALDAVALTIVDGKRKEMGMKTVKGEGRPAKFITEAAKRNLGVADAAKINTVTVTA